MDTMLKKELTGPKESHALFFHMRTQKSADPDITNLASAE
jgi:hypothetical protein